MLELIVPWEERMEQAFELNKKVWEIEEQLSKERLESHVLALRREVSSDHHRYSWKSKTSCDPS